MRHRSKACSGTSGDTSRETSTDIRQIPFFSMRISAGHHKMTGPALRVLACATHFCWQMSSILMRLFGSRSTIRLISCFTSGDVGGLQELMSTSATCFWCFEMNDALLGLFCWQTSSMLMRRTCTPVTLLQRRGKHSLLTCLGSGYLGARVRACPRRGNGRTASHTT